MRAALTLLLLSACGTPLEVSFRANTDEHCNLAEGLFDEHADWYEERGIVFAGCEVMPVPPMVTMVSDGRTPIGRYLWHSPELPLHEVGEDGSVGLVVYIADEVDPGVGFSTRGHTQSWKCGYQAAISAQADSLTLMHEVLHHLGLVHVEDEHNIMYHSAKSRGNTLTTKQERRIARTLDVLATC
jgi:hypothetical protein